MPLTITSTDTHFSASNLFRGIIQISLQYFIQSSTQFITLIIRFQYHSNKQAEYEFITVINKLKMILTEHQHEHQLHMNILLILKPVTASSFCYHQLFFSSNWILVSFSI